jgi:hypothetical protein
VWFAVCVPHYPKGRLHDRKLNACLLARLGKWHSEMTKAKAITNAAKQPEISDSGARTF